MSQGLLPIFQNLTYIPGYEPVDHKTLHFAADQTSMRSEQRALSMVLKV